MKPKLDIPQAGYCPGIFAQIWQNYFEDIDFSQKVKISTTKILLIHPNLTCGKTWYSLHTRQAAAQVMLAPPHAISITTGTGAHCCWLPREKRRQACEDQLFHHYLGSTCPKFYHGQYFEGRFILPIQPRWIVASLEDISA